MKKKKVLNVMSVVMGVAAIAALVAVIVVFTKIGDNNNNNNNVTEEVQTTTEEDKLLKAREYYTNGEYTEAVEVYKLVEKERLEEEDRYNLTDIYFEQKDMINALNYAYEYLEISKDATKKEEIYTLVADCYVNAGNYRAAFNLLNESGIENLLESYCDSKTDLLICQAPYTVEEGYLYLGSYPQKGYENVPEYVKNYEFDENGYAKIFGVEYICIEKGKQATYYAYEPVRWKILKEAEEGMHLISDMLIDTKSYSEEFKSVTWDTSDLREWMNGEFYNTCFSDSEKEYIELHTTPASLNCLHSFTSGKDVDNYIGLLSSLEIGDGRYEFDVHMGSVIDQKRKALGTDYAIAKGLYVNEENYGAWWTTTNAGADNSSVVIITEEGYILMESGGAIVNKRDIGARPFIIVKPAKNK